MKRMNSKILPIIILNWNSFDDTKECIDSILDQKSKNSKIYLLDNGSKEKDISAINEYFSTNPTIEIIYYSSNLGFTTAHNLVLQKLLDEGYNYVFLLNNDTVLAKESLKILTKHTSAGLIDMLSCKMINYHNHSLMDNAGHKIMSSGDIIPIGHDENPSNYNTVFENIGSCGGAALYSSKMLKDIGLFDEYFETGYEDAELGFRAFISGYKSQFDPEILVYHKMGQSIKKVFNYNYTLKTQCNIFYTFLKLTHWPIILIGFIPWLLRFFIISIIHLLFWRPKYLKIQYHSLYIVFIRDIKKLIKSRINSKRYRKIHWWALFKKQEFFLKRDIQNFYKLIIKGEKSYFEKY